MCGFDVWVFWQRRHFNLSMEGICMAIGVKSGMVSWNIPKECHCGALNMPCLRLIELHGMDDVS